MEQNYREILIEKNKLKTLVRNNLGLEFIGLDLFLDDILNFEDLRNILLLKRECINNEPKAFLDVVNYVFDREIEEGSEIKIYLMHYELLLHWPLFSGVLRRQNQFYDFLKTTSISFVTDRFNAASFIINDDKIFYNIIMCKDNSLLQECRKLKREKESFL